MFMNLNKSNRNALMSIAFLFIVITVLSMGRESYQPRPLVITPLNTGSIFDLESDVECTAGPTEKASPYSTQTTGGVCGAQKLVSEIAGYTIVDGIGESLI